jgi:hypothetical protein
MGPHIQVVKDKSSHGGPCAALSFIARSLQKQFSTWNIMLLSIHEEFLHTAQGSLQHLLL